MAISKCTDVRRVTTALPVWFSPALHWALAIRLDVPSLVPVAVRRVPLWVLSRYAQFVAWRVL